MAKKYFIGTDGDYSLAANWSPTNVPIAGDEVIIPYDAGDITAGLNQSAVALLSFTRQVGHQGVIGNSIQDPLRINVPAAAGAFIDIGGEGNCFLNVGASDVEVRIRETGTNFGGFGLLLQGTTITRIIQEAGNTKLIGVSAIKVECQQGGMFADRDCDFTQSGNFILSNMGGEVTVECAADTIRSRGGTTITNGAGAVALIEADGGTVISNSSGTVAQATADGTGVIDFTKVNVARTVTNASRSGGGIIKYDPDIVTLTNVPTSRGPLQLQAAAA